MREFINKFNYQYYTRERFEKFLEPFGDCEIVKVKRGRIYKRYLNLPCAFDIETSSFYDSNNQKTALMYTWQMCINGYVWIGRDYKSLWDCFNTMTQTLKLGYTKNIVLYVHNLGYEFNMLRKYMHVTDYFAVDKRSPLYVQIFGGIEFRCSYRLSGYSLDYLGKNMLHKYHVEKATGDLDYSLIRTPDTKLTRPEIGYIVNDVRVVTNYIKELMERGESLAKIPLTKTGRVRIALNQNCIRTPDGKFNFKFVEKMQKSTITLEEYKECKQAFQGGFTHSNPTNTGMTIKRRVVPFDITSDYPHIMVTKKFPFGTPKHYDNVSRETFDNLIHSCHIIARFDFVNIKSNFLHDYYITTSKFVKSENVYDSNGRLVSADSCSIYLTELDFDIIRKTYDFESVEIREALVYPSAYLPIEYVNTVLDFYESKTVLKGVKGSEIEYQNKKELLNSTYGCCASSIIKPLYTYNDGFGLDSEDEQKTIEKYNKSKKRTIFYPWAVYVTAWARWKLWTDAIIPMRGKYVYSDTDSCYVIESPEVYKHFEKVNQKIVSDLKTISKLRGIPLEKLIPKNIKGIEQPLGVWTQEDICIRFKTLGAKRYMKTLEDGTTKTTVAGLSKNAVGYIMEHGGYDLFNDRMTIPAEYSGRTTATYIDDLRTGTVTDYLGESYNYSVRCGVHMEQSSYTLSLCDRFIDYLMEVIIKYVNE